MPAVKPIDIKAIFEKQAGHPVEFKQTTIVCGERKAQAIAGNLKRR